MPRKPKPQQQPATDDGLPQKNINPYTVLGLPSTAAPSEIRSSYLKLALRLHPDKTPSSATESEKASAHSAFQSLAFAYSILSDPTRKARYDATGSTSDRPEGDEFFDWANFYRSQFKEVVTTAHIEEFRVRYQGSEEERGDVLGAYVDCEGNVEAVFERVMCSVEERDLERFRGIVEEAVRGGEVQRFERFWGDEGSGKRIGKRKGEEQEARQLARKLGVYEVLFGKDGTEAAGEGPSGAGGSRDELEGEAEVSGEDSGDEADDGGVNEDDDGFIVDGEEDEDEEMEHGNENEKSHDREQQTRKSTRTTRSSGKSNSKSNSKASSPSTLKDQLIANLTSTKPTSPPPGPTAPTSKPKKKAKAKGPKGPPAAPAETSSVPEADLPALEALIRSRQKNRFADLISSIEDRYVNNTAPRATHAPVYRGRKGKKRKVEEEAEDCEMVDKDEDEEGKLEQGVEPTEEEFEKIQRRIVEERGKGRAAAGAGVEGEGKGRGKKRGRK